MIIGIGTDIVEIDRFAELLRRQPERSLERLFTVEEQAYCQSKPEPILHFAARFAAKEACLKALGTGLQQGAKWLEMSVENNSLGAPIMKLSGRVLELSTARLVNAVHISLTHTQQSAIAFVVLESRA